MTDEFTTTVAQKFPNTLSKDPVERPWDVPEPGPMVSAKKFGEDLKRDDLTEHIHHLYAELRSSLSIRSALEYDLKKANRLLEEINRIKMEVDKVVEMLRVMEEYMKERIK